MSVENHLNLNAMGLAADITHAIVHRVTERHPAIDLTKHHILDTLREPIRRFVGEVSDKLDVYFQEPIDVEFKSTSLP